jgi:predicted enzyme related to lactoylglutathione lyase
MSANAVRDIDTGVAPVDMKFEIVVIPVSDVDRAKEFYAKLGWRLGEHYETD